MTKSSPKPEKTPTPTSATRYRVLRNGAIYDNVDKHIVGNRGDLAVVDTQITPATSGAMQAKRQELKRQRIVDGANAVVAGLGSVKNGNVFAGEGLDFVQAVAEQVTIKALDPDNPKQVDAARLLLQETGLAEQRQHEQGVTHHHVYSADPELLALLREARQLQAVDGQVAGETSEE